MTFYLRKDIKYMIICSIYRLIINLNLWIWALQEISISTYKRSSLKENLTFNL